MKFERFTKILVDLVEKRKNKEYDAFGETTSEFEIKTGNFKGDYDVEFEVGADYDKGDTGVGINKDMAGWRIQHLNIIHISKYNEDTDKYEEIKNPPPHLKDVIVDMVHGSKVEDDFIETITDGVHDEPDERD